MVRVNMEKPKDKKRGLKGKEERQNWRRRMRRGWESQIREE